MRFGKSWCCLFTGGTAGLGLASWAAISTGSYCKNKAQEYLNDKLSGSFFVRSLNVTAAIGSGPALPIQMKNLTGLMEDAVSESFLNDLMTLPEWMQYVCAGGVMVPSCLVLLTAITIGTMIIFLKEKNEEVNELINNPGSNAGSLGDPEETLLGEEHPEENIYHALGAGATPTSRKG